MTRGSAREVKSMCSAGAYKRLLSHFSRKNWEIVGFDLDHVVLRIERENIKFHRGKGTIIERRDLGPKKST